MSKSRPTKKDSRISSADPLTKAGKKASDELSEEKLKRVAGGLLPAV
ncbi:MAG: hypothetical protein ACLQME_19555 [Alphaproteobacteria bacterium]